MSIEIVIFPDRTKPDAITARAPNHEGAPLYLETRDASCGHWPHEIKIYTGSLALSTALAEAINGVMAKFAKPAPVEAEQVGEAAE